MIHEKIPSGASPENANELKELEELIGNLPQIIKELEDEQAIQETAK